MNYAGRGVHTRFKPGHHARDLTGRRFGHLVALEPVLAPPARRKWLCRCDCGGSKMTDTSTLLAGRCTHCGCSPAWTREDLTGRTFGHWTVLGFAERRGKGKASFWLCRCVCGTERAVEAENLRRGASASCGCRRVEALRATRAFINSDRPQIPVDPTQLTPHIRDRTGHRFHGWRVLALAGRGARGEARWLARCESCGMQRVFATEQLRPGASKPRCRCLPGSDRQTR